MSDCMGLALELWGHQRGCSRVRSSFFIVRRCQYLFCQHPEHFCYSMYSFTLTRWCVCVCVERGPHPDKSASVHSKKSLNCGMLLAKKVHACTHWCHLYCMVSKINWLLNSAIHPSISVFSLVFLNKNIFQFLQSSQTYNLLPPYFSQKMILFPIFLFKKSSKNNMLNIYPKSNK